MKFLLTMLGMALVILYAATGQPAYARAVGGKADSGIGLSPKKVSWGMPWEVVWNTLEPTYESRMDFSRPFDEWGMLEIKSYAYRGCVFSLKYWFYQDRLDALGFETKNDTHCISGIERELSTFYGPPQDMSMFPGAASLSWNTDRATVVLWKGRNQNVWLHFHIYDPQGRRAPDLAPDAILNTDGGVPPR